MKKKLDSKMLGKDLSHKDVELYLADFEGEPGECSGCSVYVGVGQSQGNA